MHRALFKIMIGLAVALGLTLTTAPVAQAAPAAQAQQAAATSCTTQQNAAIAAAQNYNQANAYVAAADKKVKKLKKKLKKAKKHHAPAKKIKKLKKKLKKAKKARAAGIAYRDQAAANSAAKNSAWRTCVTTTLPSSPSSPIQALCDAVPQLQPVCDALAGLLGGTSQLPISDLCEQFPEAQPLCDLLSGGAPDPATLFTVLKQVTAALGLSAQLDPILDQVQALLASLLGGGTGGLPGLPGLPSIPGLPTGGENPLCAILPLPGVC